MIRRLGRRSGAAVALLTVLLVAVPAAPAAADAQITIDSPRAQPALTSGAVSVSGNAASDTPLLYLIKSVKLAIGSDTRTVECSQQPCRFTWSVNLARNGPYQLNVTATEVTVLGVIGGSRDASRSFAVAAPPARPVMDKPTVTEGRTVTLSWSRNTEPDILYYALFRRDPGSSSFNRVGGNIDQKPTGKITYSDTTTSAYNGGDYAYQVVAVRAGASGTADTEAKSEPSGSGLASVPAPPTTTSSSTPNAPGTPAGTPTSVGPTTTVKPGAAAGVDLSGFLNSRPPAVPLTPITVPEPPDTGFSGLLPFGARPGEELEEGEAEAVPPRGSRSVITRLDNGRPLVPVAGGLVLVLLALHMRLLNRRIKAADAADLPVDRAPAPAAAAVAAAEAAAEPEPEQPEPEPEPEPEPAPEPAPAPVLYDVVADEAWAPVAMIEEIELDLEELDPEPEPEPVADVADAFELEAEVPAAGAEEIEVVEVVSPAPRRLVRAGSR